MPSSWDRWIWCLKTIGFNACPARETDGSGALKPLVSIHAQLVWRTDLMPLNHLFFITAPLEHVEFRLPKNQWLIHRRICSLPDRCHLLYICIKKMRPSANETNRLDINHWFFGRRFCLVSPGEMPRLNILMSRVIGRIWCLKTIGF